MARELARALPGTFVEDKGCLRGKEHIVSWAVGHLLELAAPERYDPDWKKWRRETLPMIPKKFKLQTSRSGGDQLRVLKALMADPGVTEIWNACDAGREGELIFAWNRESSAKKAQAKPVRRLWLSSMDSAAIKNAIGDLRPAEDYAGLEAAARMRAESDWLVGLNATRMATIHFRSAFDGVVSLGRVQTPTLALIVRRELEIRAHVAETFWTVEAEFEAGAGSYEGVHSSGRMQQSEAEEIVRKTSGNPGQVRSVEAKDGREKPPSLFDLTTLQRQANRNFGWSAKRTLSVAQRLYEHHKALTYPRTDSRFLPASMAAELPETVRGVASVPALEELAEESIALAQKPRDGILNDSGVGDHHAIIPTPGRASWGDMSDDEKRLFELVARRFLAVFHPDARFQTMTVQTDVADEKFISKGKSYSSLGWRRVESSPEDKSLPALSQGEVVTAKEITAREGQTKPPPRYTEASLLGAMETAGREIDDPELRRQMKDRGLGTPATRAAIIERLLQVEYIDRDGRTLIPTDKGVDVVTLLGGSPLLEAELTGDWEARLSEIEKGEDTGVFMKEMQTFVSSMVKSLGELERPEREVGEWGDCPGCGRALRENRKAISCWRSPDDPGCGFGLWKRIAGKTLGKRALQELINNGQTSGPVKGFKSKSGKKFSSTILLSRNKDGKWETRFPERA